MVLILDSYSKHVVHTSRKIGLFGFVTALDLIIVLNMSNIRDFSLRAHLFLRYYIIYVA